MRGQLIELETQTESNKQEIRNFISAEAKLTPDYARTRPILEGVNVGALPMKGQFDSQVGIVEFTDYQCPYCKRHFTEIFQTLDSKYVESGIVKYYISDFPLANHSSAKPAAIAASCAHEQGRYWQFHDELFDHSPGIDELTIRAITKLVGIDNAQFDECTSSPAKQAALEAQLEMAQDLGVTGTPTFLLGPVSEDGIIRNGVVLRGYQSIEIFEDVIGRILSEYR